MKNLIYLLLLFTFVSCNNAGSGEETTEETLPETEVEEAAPQDEPQEEAPQTFALVENSGFDVSNLRYEGELQTQKFWQDANGNNIVLFSGQEDLDKGEAKIYAYHYLVNDGSIERLNEMSAEVLDCADADIFLDFNEKALSVADRDGDNIGEVTFAYRKACVTDVSPHDLALHMFEGRNDYTLVGFTEVRVGPEEMMGGAISETNFDGASPSLLSHANEVWEAIKKYQ